MASLLFQAISLRAQTADRINSFIAAAGALENDSQNLNNLLKQARGAGFGDLLERLFGDETENAIAALTEDSAVLFQAAAEATIEKAEQSLDAAIEERKAKKSQPVIAPAAQTRPAVKPRRLSFYDAPKSNWRAFAFGFQPVLEDDKPDIKMTETDKEIKAEGTEKKAFETKDAKGTRTQKAETRYTKDGKTFGMEIKNTSVIEAVSKPDGKSFRQEISMNWGAEVAACPDANGVSAGTGKAHVVAKTIYTENGVAVTMSSEFDLQAKLKASVNDKAELTHYDIQMETTTTNSGYEEALRRQLIKEIKIKDGTYELDFDIPHNTPEISDGKYGGKRTPAKIGATVGRKISPMPDADAKNLGAAIGPMIPSIWTSANEMYKTAERSWKNYGCVEVVCSVAKTVLKPDEQITISAQTVHLTDGTKVNAALNAGGYPGQVAPESKNGTPAASFVFTNEATEDKTTFMVESISKRGIGKGDVEFKVEKEKEEASENGMWTGTISADRRQRIEKEKRSGANLAENGGYLETLTNIKLQLTGRLDPSTEATNAHLADVSGKQQLIDYEYDRYKIDEGYCGPNAVPYKGPKEITRTSTTTVDYNRETRVFVEIGSTGGTLTFSLPEQNGRTVHAYVHKSPCAEHDRVNTNEAIDEDAPGAGGSFSFSFPVDPAQKIVKGTITVREADGGTTVYSWELTRR